MRESFSNYYDIAQIVLRVLGLFEKEVAYQR